MAKAKGKKNGNKERASVSRERRLALVLRGLMDSLTDVAVGDEHQEQVTTAELEAGNVLKDLGYGSLVGIPKRLKELNEQLTTAIEAGDGKRIAELGLELERAKAGKEPAVAKVQAAVGGE